MIPEKIDKRMRVIWNKFNSIRPQLLSYIFDVLVEVLRWKRENPSTELLKELPRMADWAEWCEIISRCMGEKDDAFINAYNENISLQVEEIVESSELAIVIRQLVNENERTFEGTATELLLKLNVLADYNNIDRNNRYWPKTASKLSYGLHILQKTLRDIGISVNSYRDTSTKNNTRKIKIEFLSSEPSEPSEDGKSSTK